MSVDQFLLLQFASATVLLVICLLGLISRKKLGRRKLWLLCLLALGGMGYNGYCIYNCLWWKRHLTMEAKTLFVCDQKIRSEDYSEDFEEICNVVEKHYKLAERKGISLKTLREDCRMEVLRAKNNTEYVRVLQKYFAALKNLHSFPIYASYCAPARAEWRCDSLYVIASRLVQPVKSGDRILSVDGKEVAVWRDSMMQYVSASTDKARYKSTAWWVFSSYTDSIRRLGLSRGDSVFYVDVPLSRSGEKQIQRYNELSAQKEQKKNVATHKKEGMKKKGSNLEMLALHDFEENTLTRFFVQFCRVRNSRRIILDLTDNTGGWAADAELIATLFLKKPYQGKHLIEPLPQAYKGELYVMINSGTCSAAEYLASILKESGSAILVGEETAGDFGTMVLTFCTEHGTYFRLGAKFPVPTSGGTPTEGVGLLPDFPVKERCSEPFRETVRRSTMVLILKNLIQEKEKERNKS